MTRDREAGHRRRHLDTPRTCDCDPRATSPGRTALGQYLLACQHLAGRCVASCRGRRPDCVLSTSGPSTSGLGWCLSRHEQDRRQILVNSTRSHLISIRST